MYRETKPSASAIISATARWYAAMTSRRSSGSSRADSAVEPTISQNMTDSCRRSASARVATETDIGAAGPACPTGLPQPPQNLAAGSFSKPQAGHCEGSGDPHSAQKRRAPAFSAMQLRQRIYSLGFRDTIKSGARRHKSLVIRCLSGIQQRYADIQPTIPMANATIASMPTAWCLMSPVISAEEGHKFRQNVNGTLHIMTLCNKNRLTKLGI